MGQERGAAGETPAAQRARPRAAARAPPAAGTFQRLVSSGRRTMDSMVRGHPASQDVALRAAPLPTARNPPAVGADLHPQNPSGKPAAASCRDLAASASRPSGTSSLGVRREPPSWERGKRGLLRTRSIPLAPRASLSAGSVRTLLPPHALRVAQPLGPRLLGRPFPRHRAPLCPCTATAGVLNGRDLARLRSCPRKLFFTRPVRLMREIQSAAP